MEIKYVLISLLKAACDPVSICSICLRWYKIVTDLSDSWQVIKQSCCVGDNFSSGFIFTSEVQYVAAMHAALPKQLH